jgi:uncharacterized cysteine cluster protein YcgN (CxxCxxCC family)
MPESPARRFWQDKSLAELNPAEWEALCDGCGRCCLNKLEDEDTGELYFTNVACGGLDLETCRCRHYPARTRYQAECLVITPGDRKVLAQLPSTCAYVLRAAGRPLPDWHPLVSGDPDSVHRAGISVRDKAVSEEFIHPAQLPEHLISWVIPARLPDKET